jgi:hypothetical protein
VAETTSDVVISDGLTKLAVAQLAVDFVLISQRGRADFSGHDLGRRHTVTGFGRERLKVLLMLAPTALFFTGEAKEPNRRDSLERPAGSKEIFIMKVVVALLVLGVAVGTGASANAKGCIKGAIVGGVAGHMARSRRCGCRGRMRHRAPRSQ